MSNDFVIVKQLKSDVDPECQAQSKHADLNAAKTALETCAQTCLDSANYAIKYTSTDKERFNVFKLRRAENEEGLTYEGFYEIVDFSSV